MDVFRDKSGKGKMIRVRHRSGRLVLWHTRGGAFLELGAARDTGRVQKKGAGEGHHQVKGP